MSKRLDLMLATPALPMFARSLFLIPTKGEINKESSFNPDSSEVRIISPMAREMPPPCVPSPVDDSMILDPEDDTLVMNRATILSLLEISEKEELTDGKVWKWHTAERTANWAQRLFHLFKT